MPGSPPKHRVVSSLQDEAYLSNVHDAGLSGDELCSATERILNETQTKWTYFLLGCAILLPWSALSNATSFCLSRLAGSPFHPTFSSYWTSVYTWTKLVCQFYCVLTLKQSSPSRRIFTSIISLILLITSLFLSTFIRETPSTFFAFALFCAASAGVATGYLCAAVYAGAALFGTSFLQIVLSGQAAIAVATSAVQLVSSMIALWGSSLKSVSTAITDARRDDRAEEIAARIFFGVSTVFLCVTLVAYTWLARQAFYKSVIGTLEQQERGTRDVDELTSLITDDDHRHPSTMSNSQVYRVLRQNSIFMFSLIYVFTVTLAVYPAVTTRVQPVNRGIHPMLFIPFHFLVFNIGDFLGRYSCSFPRLLIWSEKKILAMSLLRTLFIPLVLLCNIDRPRTTIPVFPIIHSDILFMVIMLTVGYTTGYVSALALLAVSSFEHNPRLKGRREDVDVAATLGGSCMIFGLALGALSSFGVQAMI